VATNRRDVAGDFDYEVGGVGYATQRRTDPRVEALVHEALGDAKKVLNVGAGAGSYEPLDRAVTAIEPSAAMRAQRPPHLTPAIDAVAEDLPFADDSFDAAMAMVTVHQWKDTDAGLRELRRVSRGPVVILTFDGPELMKFWFADQGLELLRADSVRYPALEHISEVLGGTCTVTNVAIPLDCSDGWVEAFYGRPEQLLDPTVRRSQSAWGFVDPAEAERAVERLRADLASGEWDRQFGHLRTQPEYFGSLRLVVALP
jgi:SAM-dependent methyltransferase